MALPVYPAAVKAQGNKSLTVVTTIANTSAPSLASEVNAASSVNVSCMVYGDVSVTATTNKGEAPRRLCTTNIFQQLGNTTFETTDLQYAYSPQDDDTVPANKAKATLTEGTTVYLVERLGLAAQTEVDAVGQQVNIYQVRLGPQNRTMTGDGEFDEFSITQSAVVIAPPVYDVALAA